MDGVSVWMEYPSITYFYTVLPTVSLMNALHVAMRIHHVQLDLFLLRFTEGNLREPESLLLSEWIAS